MYLCSVQNAKPDETAAFHAASQSQPTLPTENATTPKTRRLPCTSISSTLDQQCGTHTKLNTIRCLWHRTRPRGEGKQGVPRNNNRHKLNTDLNLPTPDLSIRLPTHTAQLRTESEMHHFPRGSRNQSVQRLLQRRFAISPNLEHRKQESALPKTSTTKNKIDRTSRRGISSVLYETQEE